jgi:hypothetical protein
MIGILCSEDTVKKYIEEFRSLYKNFGSKKDDDIIIFTISNINFDKDSVKGYPISASGKSSIEVPIPATIFNLSLMKDVKSVKSRRKLEEMKKITLINSTNRYDQWMIRDMINSSNLTKKYILPYYIYNKAEKNYKPDDDKSYVIMPIRGSSISRVIYAKPDLDPNSDTVSGTQYFKKGHICDYIDASLCQTQWIFIEVPNLITFHDHPIIVRNYLQKNTKTTWRLLGQNFCPEYKLNRLAVLDNINKASLTTMEYINHFLPSLGITFIDFIIGTDGKPYFLHFSGFEQNFFELKQNKLFYNKFYNNMLSLAADNKRMKTEV